MQRVSDAIADAGAVLITGPANAKNELVKHIERHVSELGTKIAGVETLDHPTDESWLPTPEISFAPIIRCSRAFSTAREHGKIWRSLVTACGGNREPASMATTNARRVARAAGGAQPLACARTLIADCPATIAIDRPRRLMMIINILDRGGAVHWSFPDDQLEGSALRG